MKRLRKVLGSPLPAVGLLAAALFGSPAAVVAWTVHQLLPVWQTLPLRSGILLGLFCIPLALLLGVLLGLLVAAVLFVALILPLQHLAERLR